MNDTNIFTAHHHAHAVSDHLFAAGWADDPRNRALHLEKVRSHLRDIEALLSAPETAMLEAAE